MGLYDVSQCSRIVLSFKVIINIFYRETTSKLQNIKEFYNMDNTTKILDELKGMECPVDEVAGRVIEVLEKHEVDGSYQIVAREDEDFINDGIKVYNAFAETPETPSIQIVVQEGMDNYVARIIDVSLIDTEASQE